MVAQNQFKLAQQLLSKEISSEGIQSGQHFESY